MNELSIAAKFMTWVIGVVVALGLFGELKPLTYKMAEAAIDAQQHQMSYGAFSRQLWSQRHKNAHQLAAANQQPKSAVK